MDQEHESENDVDLPQMYARYTREVNDAFSPPSPTDVDFGVIYLNVRPPRDMLSPGLGITSSPCSDDIVPVYCLPCESEVEVSAPHFYRNYRRELLRSILGLVMIFIISRDFLNQLQ